MTTRRPLIGLSGRRKTGADVIGTPEVLLGLEADWYYADYARGVYEAGGLPVNLPLDVDPAMFADHLDGILLSGGADVDPANYNTAPATDLFPPEPQRDSFELGLLDAAAANELPVLGICRGLQLINVHNGGTLHQHVPEHSRFDVDPQTLAHDVQFTKGSQLGALYGESLSVNSLHHQTVDVLGDGLVVTASHDGSPEGLEHSTLPIVAVQWHPEMLPTRTQDPVFGWLVEAARR